MCVLLSLPISIILCLELKSHKYIKITSMKTKKQVRKMHSIAEKISNSDFVLFHEKIYYFYNEPEFICTILILHCTVYLFKQRHKQT